MLGRAKIVMSYYLRFISVLMISSTTFFNCNRKEHPPVPANSATRYKAGQVWQYNTRASEPQSFLRILRVEQDSNLGLVIHISIENIHLRNPGSPSGFSDRLPHMPISAPALDSSVLKLLDHNSDIPDFQSGYDHWKQARGGVFSITVAQALDHVELAVNK